MENSLIKMRESLYSTALADIKAMISEDPILAELTQGGQVPTAEEYKALHPVSPHWHKDPEIVPLAYILLSSIERHAEALKKLRGEN